MLTDLAKRKLRTFQTKVEGIKSQKEAHYTACQAGTAEMIRGSVLFASDMTSQIADNLTTLVELILAHDSILHWKKEEHREEAKVHLALFTTTHLALTDALSVDLVREMHALLQTVSEKIDDHITFPARVVLKSIGVMKTLGQDLADTSSMLEGLITQFDTLAGGSADSAPLESPSAKTPTSPPRLSLVLGADLGGAGAAAESTDVGTPDGHLSR